MNELTLDAQNYKRKEAWDQIQARYYKETKNQHKDLFEQDSAYFRSLFEFFYQKINCCSSDRLFEVGANAGRYTKEFLKRSHKVVASDICHESLDILCKDAEALHIGRNLEIFKGDIATYRDQHPENLFDVIYCTHVMHNVYRVEPVIKAASDMLRPGGRFCCLEPNPFNLMWYIHVFLNPNKQWLVEKGILNCTYRKMMRAFKKCGLNRIEYHPIMFFPPQMINVFPALMHLERRMNKINFLKFFLSVNVFVAYKC